MPRWRVRGVGKKDARVAGIGIPISIEPGQNLPLTNVYDLMQAIKYNLKQFCDDDPGRAVGSGEIISDMLMKSKVSWKTGFVFPDTVLPAVTVFPISKIFHPRKADGWQYVEYRFTIDVFSKRRVDYREAKQFCLEAMDDVVQCVKSRVKMIDANGYAHCFSTKILGTSIYEPTSPADRGFQSKASVQISCMAWHRMNPNRVFPSAGVIDKGYEIFFDHVIDLVGGTARSEGVVAREWINRVIRPIKRYPAVLTMPEDQSVLEIRSNETVDLERPVRFQVVSRGVPKIDLLEKNMDIADDLVDIIEEKYALGGYAEDCEIRSIEYLPVKGGLVYISIILVTYKSKLAISTVYTA